MAINDSSNIIVKNMNYIPPSGVDKAKKTMENDESDSANRKKSDHNVLDSPNSSVSSSVTGILKNIERTQAATQLANEKSLQEIISLMTNEKTNEQTVIRARDKHYMNIITAIQGINASIIQPKTNESNINNDDSINNSKNIDNGVEKLNQTLLQINNKLNSLDSNISQGFSLSVEQAESHMALKIKAEESQNKRANENNKSGLLKVGGLIGEGVNKLGSAVKNTVGMALDDRDNVAIAIATSAISGIKDTFDQLSKTKDGFVKGLMFLKGGDNKLSAEERTLELFEQGLDNSRKEAEQLQAATQNNSKLQEQSVEFLEQIYNNMINDVQEMADSTLNEHALSPSDKNIQSISNNMEYITQMLDMSGSVLTDVRDHLIPLLDNDDLILEHETNPILIDYNQNLKSIENTINKAFNNNENVNPLIIDVPQLESPEISQLESPEISQLESPEISQLNTPKISQLESPVIPKLESLDVKLSNDSDNSSLNNINNTLIEMLNALQLSHNDMIKNNIDPSSIDNKNLSYDPANVIELSETMSVFNEQVEIGNNTLKKANEQTLSRDNALTTINDNLNKREDKRTAKLSARQLREDKMDAIRANKSVKSNKRTNKALNSTSKAVNNLGKTLGKVTGVFTLLRVGAVIVSGALMLFGVLSSAVGLVMGSIPALIILALVGLATAVYSWWDELKQFGNDSMEWMKKQYDDMLEWWKNLDIFGSIKDAFSNFFDWMIHTINDYLPNSMQIGPVTLTEAEQQSKTEFEQNPLNEGKEWVKPEGEGLLDDAWEGIKSFGSDVKNNIIEADNILKENIKAGAHIVKDLILPGKSDKRAKEIIEEQNARAAYGNHDVPIGSSNVVMKSDIVNNSQTIMPANVQRYTGNNKKWE